MHRFEVQKEDFLGTNLLGQNVRYICRLRRAKIAITRFRNEWCQNGGYFCFRFVHTVYNYTLRRDVLGKDIVSMSRYM